MIKFEREYLSDSFIEEITPLLIEHKDEVAVYDFFNLSPKWDVYRQLEDLDNIVFITARDPSHNLVGYVIYYITPSLHYSDEVYADMDVLFLDPSVRESGVGREMIAAAEEIILEDTQVTMFTMKMKTWAMFERLARDTGYEEKEIMYTKYVGGR